MVFVSFVYMTIQLDVIRIDVHLIESHAVVYTHVSTFVTCTLNSVIYTIMVTVVPIRYQLYPSYMVVYFNTF